MMQKCGFVCSRWKPCLDIVRRDQLSRDSQQPARSRSVGGGRDVDVTEAVHDIPRTVREQVNAGQIAPTSL
jgi:hypothetical protein